MDKLTRPIHAGFCFLVAIVLTVASFFAVDLFRFVATDQFAVDPRTHFAAPSPWWTVFHGSDAGFSVGCLGAALCLVGLAGLFVRAAFIK